MCVGHRCNPRACRLRELTTDLEFRYDLNRGRLHFADVFDGSRAARELGYEPAHAIDFRSNGAGPARSR